MAYGYLRQATLLDHLSHEQQAHVRALTKDAEYAQGAVIADPASFSISLFFIESGVVQLRAATPSIHRSAIFLAPGDLFGALPTHDKNSNLEAIAVSSTAVQIMDQAALADLILQYPAIATTVISNLLAYGATLQQQLETLAFEQPTQRLVTLLLRLGAHHGLVEGKDILLDMKLTHSDLSRMTGLPASVVRTLLAQWQKSGALSRQRNHWRLDPEQLRQASACTIEG